MKLIRDAIAIIACLLLLSGCTFLPGMTHIITFTEKSEPTVHAATNRGLSISTDESATFTNRTIAEGLGNNTVYGVYAVGATVYAATDGGGLSISTDGGAPFTNRPPADGLGSNIVEGVYVTP